MTAADEPRSVAHALEPDATSDPTAARVAARARALNVTHAMTALRARGGVVVRSIEARRRRLVARRVLRRPHRRVVDVGCEDAWTTEAWAKAAEEVALVDVDPAVLERARLAAAPGVQTLVAEATDGGRLARLGHGRWDVVVLSALLEHLPRPAAALDALTPLLAPGGRFVVYVPADRPILALKRVLALLALRGLVRGLSLEPAPGHVHVFDRRRLRALLLPRGRLVELVFDPAVLGYLAVLLPHARGEES